MAVNLIGGVSASNTTDLQVAGVSQQDFFKILVAQLSFQDPLKPIDNQQFIAQIAQFTSLEQTRQMNDRFDTLLTLQAATQSIGLIGKTVEIVTEGGAIVGKVSTLRFSSGQPLLTIATDDGRFLTDIGVDKVSLIR
jgi:flagellar basal-body rod modification protein FlgD